MSVSYSDLFQYLNQVIKDTERGYKFQVDELFKVKSSNRATENYIENAMTGLVPKKAKGASIDYDQIYAGNELQLRADTYKLGIKVAEEDMQDENWGMYDSLGTSLAMSDRQTVETLGFNILNNAFDSSVQVGGDGLELCSTAHILLGGGTWSNELATPARLSMTSFESIRTLARRMPNARGLTAAAMLQKLIIPTELYKIASEIVNSAQDPETANNAVNAFKGKVSILESPYLTNTVRWFVQTSVDGLIKQDRMPAKFERDSEFETGDARFKTTRRIAFGWQDPRNIVGSAAV